MGEQIKQLELFEGYSLCKDNSISIDIRNNISERTNEIKKIFTAFGNMSTTCVFANELTFDIDVKPLIETIEKGAKKTFKWRYNIVKKEPLNIQQTKNIVVCFSGGKDSTATAIKMRECGWNVYLFYVKGINKSYPDECDRAKEIARYLDMPLHIIELRQTGKTTFYDNPIKNQLISSMALDYAIKENIGVDVAFGDFMSDNIDNSSFNEDWSDCKEMWQAYTQYIHKWIPNANVHIPFHNYLETMDIIGKDNKLLNMVQGCVLPHRFRSTRKNENEKKYNIKLLENRCGSCWKCCAEYIHYAEKGIIKYDHLFYKHCLDVLVKKAKDLKPNTNNQSISDVYEAFLYSDFSKSKFHKEDK